MQDRINKQFKYATLAQRFLALVIDFIILSLIFFPVTKIVKGVWIMSNQEHQWSYGWFITDPLCISFLIVIILYFIILEGTIGATIGKKVLGMQIITNDGSKIGLWQAVVRNFLRIVDALPAFNILGVVLIIKSPENARFGDRIAGTRVILRH